jgi:hypothetical protein
MPFQHIFVRPAALSVWVLNTNEAPPLYPPTCLACRSTAVSHMSAALYIMLLELTKSEQHTCLTLELHTVC